MWRARPLKEKKGRSLPLASPLTAENLETSSQQEHSVSRLLGGGVGLKTLLWREDLSSEPETVSHVVSRREFIDENVTIPYLDWIVIKDAYGVKSLEHVEQHPLLRYNPLLKPRSNTFPAIHGFAHRGKAYPENKRFLAMATTTPSRGGVSPSSSPRLPSPPPMAEIQFGPQSPSISAVGNELQLDSATQSDASAGRRIRPGTKAIDMASGPPLVPLQQLDSPFQLQEHLKALYSSLTHTPTSTVPVTKETALQIAKPPQISDTEVVDKNLWLYELCRFLVLKANIVSISLMADTPPCSSLTCPEMRASEWQYLCAVHEPPKSCCAIDYCNHTLDWAANVLTSPKHFPSRLQLGGDTGNVFQSMRQLTNIFRRVYRIFAHAWFQHREIFWNIEAVYGIYILFKTVCNEYQLIPEDNYTVPPEAEGPSMDEEMKDIAYEENAARIQILRKENEQPSHENGHNQNEPQTSNLTNTTTRRHKHTPSTGSHVTTIQEGQEEEDEPAAASQPTEISPPKPKFSTPERTLPTLGRLNIGNTIPAYVPRLPEDPTPTQMAPTEDPLAAAGRRSIGIESEVRSPGGGSIRTGGPDVLNASLGHMEEFDDPPKVQTEEEAQDETVIATGEEVDEDANETMERIDIPSPEVLSKSPRLDQEAGTTDLIDTQKEEENEAEKSFLKDADDDNEDEDDDQQHPKAEGEATGVEEKTTIPTEKSS